MKVCIRCKEEKVENCFSADRSKLDRLQTYCKLCVYLYNKTYTQRSDVKARHNARTKKFYHENKERYRAYYRKSELKSLYGITLNSYNELLQKQEYKCLICGIHQETLPYKMCVDHNHQTKEVRGLLCKPCNLIIGNAKDSIPILHKAVQYLTK